MTQAAAPGVPQSPPIAGEFLRYVAASGVALGVDYGLLVALTEFAGLHYLLSAALGFVTGAAVMYLLSVRFVFRHRRLSDRRLEFGLFVTSGLVGLVAGQLLLYGFVEWAGLPYWLAKAPSAGGSFILNFILRRIALFAPARGG